MHGLDDSTASAPISLKSVSKDISFGIVTIKDTEIIGFQKNFYKNIQENGYETRASYGHKILHQMCSLINDEDFKDPDVRAPLEHLINGIMIPAVSGGSGLAANQIAVNARVFAMHCPKSSGSDSYNLYNQKVDQSKNAGIFDKDRSLVDFLEAGYMINTDQPMYFINPEIIDEVDGCSLDWVEGCFSLPGYAVPQRRSAAVTVRYQNLDGEVCMSKFFGWLAECAVHETAHLDGKLMTDHIPPHKLISYMNKFKS